MVNIETTIKRRPKTNIRQRTIMMDDTINNAIKREKFERKNRQDYERVLSSTMHHQKSLSMSSKVNQETNVQSEAGSNRVSILFKNNTYRPQT